MKMKKVSSLNVEEIFTLQEMSQKHPLSSTRIRANAVILSDHNVSLQNIASIFGICRQTISIWIDHWESDGLCGLMDKSGRGRKKILSNLEENEVIDMIISSPRSLKQIVSKIDKKGGIKISKETLKRLCKKKGLSWKRVRQSLRGKRDQKEFEISIKEIDKLKEQAYKGNIDFYYFDESGFTLEPCIPYAWQKISETIEVACSRSKRLNVLGFIDQKCHFESFVFEGSITSDVVIACFDKFAQTLTKKTVLLIDNAPIHTSNIFQKNREHWEKQGLIIYNIPAYSPELNKIEILWRKIKYEWLDFSAYESFQSLKDSLNEILANVGINYHINFV